MPVNEGRSGQRARLLLDAYGEGGFRVGGTWIAGSILLTPGFVRAWGVSHPDQARSADLLPWLAETQGTEILIFGSGVRTPSPALTLRAELRAQGVALEWMATGSACRTFNLLCAEGRRVAAALIAV
jgi:uncharacterized protein